MPPDGSPMAALLELVGESYAEFERHRVLVDHSTRLATEELDSLIASLEASERRFRSMARSCPTGIVQTDATGACVYSNGHVHEIFGLDEDGLLGMGWWDRVHPDDRHLLADLARRPDLATGRWEIEHRLCLEDETEAWVSTAVAAMVEPSGELVGWVANISDITERRSHQHDLEHVADHDGLTELLNRRGFVKRLGELCDRQTADGRIAVALVDLDRFKLVNDTFGHQTGDRLLVAVADRLRLTLRDDDLVCRLGGDEFAVASVRRTTDGPGAFAESISAAVRGPVELDGRVVHVDGSVGVATASGTASPDGLLRDADTAMYCAKRVVGRSWYVFDESFRSEVTRRFALENGLRRAIDQGGVDLVYQPIVNGESGDVVLVEALARFTHDDLGVIAPDEFIRVAEEIGLICALGETLMDRACAQIARWRREHPELEVSVNVSPFQIADPEFVGMVLATLDRHGLDASALTLELTESAILADVDQSLLVLDRLRRHGVTVALDDFGTGYSSLSYLERLPVDYLKIDRSFVSSVVSATPGQSTSVMAETIIDMARRFGMTPIAEGVETSTQHRHLNELRCDLVQGFLYSRPLPADQVDLGSSARVSSSNEPG